MSSRWLALALLGMPASVSADRLYVCGWELRTTRPGVETVQGISSPADAGRGIDESTVPGPHGGVAVGRTFAIPGTRSSFRHPFLSGTPGIFIRLYLRVEQPVNVRSTFLVVRRSSAVPVIASLTIDPGNVVRTRVWITDAPGTVTLSTGVWHRLDIFVDERGGTGQHSVQIALDGNTFVLIQNQTFSHIVDAIETGINLGGEMSSSGAISYDDVAVNDVVGTAENSFPGPGRMYVLRPNGQAGVPGWGKSDGGAPGADNWADVSEISPDDAASALAVSTNQSTADEYEVDAPPPSTGAGAVRLVSVGVRFVGSGTMPSALAVSVRAAAAGLQRVSADVPTDDVSWVSNRVDGYLNLPLVMTTTPEGQPWTPTTLDTLRIGIVDADSASRLQTVSAVWATVELAAAGEPAPPALGVLGDGGTGAQPPDSGTMNPMPDGGAPDAGIGPADGGQQPPPADGGAVVVEPARLTVGCGCSAGAMWPLAAGCLALFRRCRRGPTRATRRHAQTARDAGSGAR